MNLNRVYKYISPDHHHMNESDNLLLLRYEYGDWMITLLNRGSEVLRFEWFQTPELFDTADVAQQIQTFINAAAYDPLQIHVIVCSADFHLFPLGFTYDYPESSSAMIQLTDAEIVRSESLKGFKDMELAFKVPKILMKVINQVLPACHISHQALVFYDETRMNPTAESVQICVYKRYLLLQATVNHETFILKRISFETKEDLLFEVLSVYKHFSMNPQEIPLFAGGLISEESELFQLLRRYIQNVQIKVYNSVEHLHHLPDLFENHLIEKV